MMSRWRSASKPGTCSAWVSITRQPIGSNGFGFDPVLYLPALGKTFAELPPAEKNRLSHRGQAAAAMLQLLRTNWLPAAASTTSS